MFSKQSILNYMDGFADPINRLDFARSGFGNTEARLYELNRRNLGPSWSKYPSDLGLNPEYQVVMEIDIWENDSKVLNTRRETVVATLANNVSETVQSNLGVEDGQEVDALGMLGNVAGASISALGQGFNQPVNAILRPLVGGDLSGRGTGEFSYTEEQTGLAGGTKFSGKRLYLYLPSGIETKYGFVYEDKDMAALGPLQLAKALAQAANGDEGAKALAAELGKQVGMANIKVLDKLGETVGVEAGTFRSFAEASQRQVLNPLTTHLFRTVDRRSFSFTWTFYPKNREDLANVYEIIHTFKYYAHPRRSEGAGRFLDYPAEFKIRFKDYSGNENQYLPRIMRCVAKSVTAKYGEDGVFTTLQNDALGSPPTKITLTVDFTELELLTQDRFEVAPGSIQTP
jgi:hypothetical protein